jgi:hypothetical protein
MASKIQINTFDSATAYYSKNDYAYFTCPAITTKLNKDGEEKKNCPKFPNHKNFTLADYNKHHQRQDTLCLITGERNNITVIDFDDLIAYEKLVNKYKELKKHYTVRTKKGVHIYFEYDKRFKTSIKCFKDYEGVDIRNDGGLVFAPPTKYELLDGSFVQYMHNGKTLKKIPEFMYDLLKDERIAEPKKKTTAEPKKKTKTNNIKQNENAEVNENIKSLTELIDVKYIDDFDSWLRIVWAMKEEGFTEDEIRTLSQKSSHYSDDGFKNAFDKAPSNITVSQGTLNHYAKLSNKKKYLELMKEKHEHDKEILLKPLPELNNKPNVEDNDTYLSNIFTQEMYNKNDIIVLQSCCGTGKTYSVAKYVAEANDKVISIVNRKSLLSAQIKEFDNKSIKLNNYENKDTYKLDENGIICINSIMKYSNQSDAQFNDFVVYIDEANSFIETLTHSPILTKDIKLVYDTLIRIIKNCKKLILSDHTIHDGIFHMFRSMKNKRTLYVKNKYQKFKGVKAKRIRNEKRFKQEIECALKSNIGFFAGFDSARTATQYYHALKHLTNRECVLVTDESGVQIPNNLNEWEGKCVFYSPKIETGCDFSIDTKQKVFYHMKGQSVLPTSSFQMICRTRNMANLTWYAEKQKKHTYKYESLNDCYLKAEEHKQNTSLYMCSSYLNENDEIKYAPNSFYNMYILNEYIKDIYEHNKAEHLAKILLENGFDCEDDVAEVEQKLDKMEAENMKIMSEEALEETFTKWKDKEVINTNFDVRSNSLGLNTDELKETYKDYIINKQTYEEYNKITTLMKDNNYIMSKAENAIENSYAEFGIHNCYSKVKLLAEFEQQTNIKRFDFSEATPTNIKDETWKMIQKLFRKTTKKPTDEKAVIKEYVSMINSFVKLYDGQRKGKATKNNKVYTLDSNLISDAFELDFIKLTPANPYKNYDVSTVNRVGLTMPHIEVDQFQNIIIDDD